jgi:CheY-like chemotaxis protein
MKPSVMAIKGVAGTVMLTKRVLVIDDQPDVQAVVQACLEEIAGWQVTTATSGQEGLIKVATDQPDAILLDMMMPGMDGFAFLKALRVHPAGAVVPVVLLTAKSHLPQVEELQALGVKGVIAKPFDPFRLAVEIATLLTWDLGWGNI